MALTPMRWIAIAIAGMLSAVILIFDEQPPRELSADELRTMKLEITRGIHSQRANRLVRQYRMVQVTDSLRPRAVNGPAVPPLRLSFGPGIPEATRALIDSSLAMAREKVGTAPQIGVDVVAIIDSGMIEGVRIWSGAVNQFFILPRRPTERCVVVLAIGHSSARRILPSYLTADVARQHMIGPCAYYAAFGMPGDPMRTWIGRGSTYALGGSWTRATPPSDYTQGFYYNRAPLGNYFPSPHRVLDYLSPRATSCITGDFAACEATVVKPMWRSEMLTVGSTVRVAQRVGSIGYAGATEFGGREAEMFADMVRGFGRERFAQFWRSNEPLPVSFQQVSGVPLGEWVYSWANEYIPEIQRGPSIPASSLLAALGVLIVSALITMVVAQRRVFE